MHTNLIALTAALAAAATAFDCHGPYFSFYNRAGPSMSYQRLDPALFPGVESPHLHSFDGGNAIASSLDFADTQASTCTTARIKPDKSIYWRPTLFWNGNNTGYYRVPDQYLKIYYKFGDSGNVKANVSEFPEDFAMIAGNAFLRHDDGVVGTNKGPGLGWSCKGDNYQSTDAIGFPKGFTSCPNGFAAQLTFPSCWNGNPLDPSKPSAHMTWPTGSGTGINACPEGFQVARFPTIFIEFWYDVSAFDGQYTADQVPWVLANGDPTGYGFHADFRNGWEKGVLAKATADEGYCNCGCGCGNDEMKQCFGSDNVNDDSDTDFKTCAAAKVEFPGDDKSPLQSLPGCNPIQSGPADATQASGAGCVATPVSSGIVSSANSATATSTAQPAKSSAAQSYGSSAKASSSGGNVSPSSIEAAAASITSTSASLTLSFPGKGVGYETQSAAVSSTLTNAAESGVKASGTAPASKPTFIHSGAPYSNATHSFTNVVSSGIKASGSFVLASSAAAALSGHASASGNGDCNGPTTITLTPTVTVTAGANGSNGECAPTVYSTVTNRVTVTVPAGGYKHKRHADMHRS